MKNRFIITVLLILVVVVSTGIIGHAYDGTGLEKESAILFDLLNNGLLEGIEPQGGENDYGFEILGFSDQSFDMIATGDRFVNYIVQPGDSLYRIASKFKTTVDKIRSLNGLYSNYLYVGQKLQIPTEEIYIAYTVRPGDSLFKIATEFDTTVSNLKMYNNLNSNYLYVGQQLSVPIKNPQNNYTYTVQNGDSIYKIALKFKTTVDKIKQVNSLASNYIYIGQKLNIPINGYEYSEKRLDISEGELELLARAVYSEARGEPYEGQVAIAAVIINRVLHPLFPNTIEGVVFQPWQFTAVHDGQFWLHPNQQAYKASNAALDGWDPTDGAIYYYNPDTATSRWVFYRTVIVKIGNHYFAV